MGILAQEDASRHKRVSKAAGFVSWEDYNLWSGILAVLTTSALKWDPLKILESWSDDP